MRPKYHWTQLLVRIIVSSSPTISSGRITNRVSRYVSEGWECSSPVMYLLEKIGRRSARAKVTHSWLQLQLSMGSVCPSIICTGYT